MGHCGQGIPLPQFPTLGKRNDFLGPDQRTVDTVMQMYIYWQCSVVSSSCGATMQLMKKSGEHTSTQIANKASIAKIIRYGKSYLTPNAPWPLCGI
ncbi:hypothetical protein BELL_0206g00100 [Botrytis elliptica]|uniref:Uncharacterized protein n=1 Tax=Botrytis elliptica TaxID=278938 RepID=A0A4Z1JQD9_9HELO|nr:hypothetical protein BELL_0206g00100 [Botrytis elliptica]